MKDYVKGVRKLFPLMALALLLAGSGFAANAGNGGSTPVVSENSGNGSGDATRTEDDPTGETCTDDGPGPFDGEGSNGGNGPDDASENGTGDGICTGDGPTSGAGAGGESVAGIGNSLLGGQGPPILDEVTECTSGTRSTSGTVQLRWRQIHGNPDRMQACAYDIYNERWVRQQDGEGAWCDLDASASTGSLRLGSSGAYFAWVSNQYGNGNRQVSEEPTVFIHYNGTPNEPRDFEAVQLGPNEVRLQWKPEIYGTWLNWMIAYHMPTNEWVELEGPHGADQWHYTCFGDPDFELGEVDFTVPDVGEYVFFMMPMAWDAKTAGNIAMTSVNVE